MSLQDGATVKIVEKITRINAKMCGFLWRYSTRLSNIHQHGVQEVSSTRIYLVPCSNLLSDQC